MGFDSFGKFNMSRAEAPFETRPIIRAADERAKEVLAGDAIDPEEFRGLYGSEIIDKDLATVERIKKTFNHTGRAEVAGRILEGIIYDQSELSDWLGPYAQTMKTSEYDDYVNGVDLVVEFDKPGERHHLALGVDATFGVNYMTKKFERIKGEIDSGELTSIKYFRSSNSRIMGRLKHVPRVVTGIDQEHLQSLAQTWTNKENKALAVHPAQRLVLAQIAQQLKTFGRYAERTGRAELVRPFQEAYATVRGVSDTKTSIDISSVRDDKVHAEIIRNLEMFR